MAKYHLKYKRIKPDTLKAIQDHWDKGFWKEGEDHKREVFTSLLSKLCEIYSIKNLPHLVILKEFNDERQKRFNEKEKEYGGDDNPKNY